MKKTGMLSDISETLLELGKSTATQSVKAVGQTLDPTKMAEKVLTPQGNDAPAAEKAASGEKVPNSTELNLDKLQKKYDGEDNVELMAMRQKLFKIVKEGEEKAIFERKQDEQERKRKEAQEKEEKKKKQQQAQQQVDPMPKGKERKSIMGAHKKKADLSHAETKPSVSKG